MRCVHPPQKMTPRFILDRRHETTTNRKSVLKLSSIGGTNKYSHKLLYTFNANLPSRYLYSIPIQMYMQPKITVWYHIQHIILHRSFDW